MRDAASSARLYWDQAADFGRRHLAGATGLDRIVEIGEKIIAAAPDPGLPLFAGWSRMPRAEDAPARALQVMFILRELRASVHFWSPVEAHILSKGSDYAAFMGWRKPYPDGAGKQERLADAEVATNRRMAEIIGKPSAALNCRNSRNRVSMRSPGSGAEIVDLRLCRAAAFSVRLSGRLRRRMPQCR